MQLFCIVLIVSLSWFVTYILFFFNLLATDITPDISWTIYPSIARPWHLSHDVFMCVWICLKFCIFLISSSSHLVQIIFSWHILLQYDLTHLTLLRAFSQLVNNPNCFHALLTPHTTCWVIPLKLLCFLTFTVNFQYLICWILTAELSLYGYFVNESCYFVLFMKMQLWITKILDN